MNAQRIFSVLLTTLLAVPAVTVASAAPSSYLGNLHYRFIGPFRGGRALAVTGVPGAPYHFYFGAVDGGVWESTNAGRTWNPIFDTQDVASIGAIAVAPSNPRVVYVGTGEADMRSDMGYGDGVYKSGDGGSTWTHVGLEDTRQIGKILVDPHDADVVYVAALGHAYGPNVQRGVFKSIDGGAHWTKVLYLNNNTGAIDLSMNPQDPQTILAALWQTRRPPWNVYPPSNGPSSGLYLTHDGGATWSHITQGLPPHVGRIGISFSPTGQRVYAVVDSDVQHGGLYRSDDGGITWRHIDSNTRLWTRGWYFSGVTADPQNADVVYVMNTSTYRSTNGGKSFNAIKGDPTGDDFHALWIDPTDNHRMILGSDQGVIVSVDGAKTWSSWYNQPTAQFYHVTTDNRFPYWVYGAQQDSGTLAMPSTGRYSTITVVDWHWIDAGGEDGYHVADPRHPGMIYGSTTDGAVVLENIGTGWRENINPTLAYQGRIWRAPWNVPLAMAADHRTLYYGHQNIFRSRDRGQTWQIVSPDLTRRVTPNPPNLDPPTLADDNGLQRHGVVYALAPSPLDARLVWVGTDDGLVWLTRDDAVHWRNVTPAQLTPWSEVGIIQASHFDRATAYIAIDRHNLDDFRPHIYRTHNWGRAWTPITNGIPYGDFVNVVREDPFARGLLFAGTEKGVEVSFDDGNHWQSLQLNLPVSSVRDFNIHGEDLVVATHGRGMWILDGITSLRQMADAVAAKGSAYLFALPPVFRVGVADYNEGTPYPYDEPQANDAPIGVNIDYIVRNPGTVTIGILDARGNVVRRWSSDRPSLPADPVTLHFPPDWAPTPPVPSSALGSHRFLWDFHTGGDEGPLAPPGRYTVQLVHDGAVYARSVTVMRDPRITASDADLRAQYELAEAIEARKVQIAGAQRETKNARILGIVVPNPDNTIGSPSHDFTSLRALSAAFDLLEQAVESADAAPTPDMQRAYNELSATLATTLRKIGH